MYESLHVAIKMYINYSFNIYFYISCLHLFWVNMNLDSSVSIKDIVSSRFDNDHEYTIADECLCRLYANGI